MTVRIRVVVAVALATVLGAGCSGGDGGTDEEPPAASGPCRSDTRHDDEPRGDGKHVPDPSYEVLPPSGGAHLALPAPPGVFTPGRAPEPGNVVHALEHGYIALWYRPDVGEATVTALVEVHEQFPMDVLVVPLEGMDVPVAATGWHRRLLCDEPDASQLERFVRTYRNKGPEKVPHQTNPIRMDQVPQSTTPAPTPTPSIGGPTTSRP